MEKQGIDATYGRILVVEDDPDTRDLLVTCLPSGYRVVATMAGEEAVFVCRQVRFDLALVDVRLPDVTGIDLVGRLQHIDPGMPILLTTAFPNFSDAFWAGDRRGVVGYLEKPFSVLEPKKRVEQALAERDHERWLWLDDLVIDCAAKQVSRDGRRQPLTQQEVDILIRLVRAGRNGQIVRYEELVAAGWACDPSPEDVGLVRVAIGRLRQKLNDDPRRPRYIETVRGIGYRAVPAADSEQV